jgi:hypothetical protein
VFFLGQRVLLACKFLEFWFEVLVDSKKSPFFSLFDFFWCSLFWWLMQLFFRSCGWCYFFSLFLRWISNKVLLFCEFVGEKLQFFKSFLMDYDC